MRYERPGKSPGETVAPLKRPAHGRVARAGRRSPGRLQQQPVRNAEAAASMLRPPRGWPGTQPAASMAACGPLVPRRRYAAMDGGSFDLSLFAACGSTHVASRLHRADVVCIERVSSVSAPHRRRAGRPFCASWRVCPAASLLRAGAATHAWRDGASRPLCKLTINRGCDIRISIFALMNAANVRNPSKTADRFHNLGISLRTTIILRD